ncbi:hypothetical protein GCM10011348_14060 [Marinobacterium nitratireducens]|uniref:Peptide O-xylosyltransferase n=1 Tax=Marinobacterium nitratireducens TaxID=518897 RepID=A0A917ZAE3_9GAMM|nr:beta-1,6-N-acetylglucosaminyltransferase [Marinobacterium nitratireducens]GGO79535.1 hypothetical protein GCM10011348_14060 [Marinobacterium nitratireducens]
MKVSFVLLAHEAPEQLKGLIQSLLAAGSNIYMHHDASSSGDVRTASASWGLDALPGKLYLADRVKVVWGEWSIVEATLNCMQLIREHDTDSDYFMLLSGSCMPVKPVALLQEYLAQSGKDHIEAVNAEKQQWVTAGLQKQRWSKFHFFNWRYQTFLFDTSLKIQRKLKIKREIPLGHTAHMGSQWWCIRRGTLMSVLDLIESKPVLRRFYKRTWVPDELFFQTLVANLVPKSEISSELLTRYTFNSWGIPLVYYDDDYPELLAESRFFVRKVSHRAKFLRERLASIASMSVNEMADLLEQSETERNALMERIDLQKQINESRWHSLESHKENRYDYIKSIPNPMVVLVGEDTPAKRQALAQIDRLDDTVVYGDLFDPAEVGKGYDHTGYLGVGRDAVKLVKHTWHQVLGDIAYRSPGKTIVFSLGRNFKQYLEVLRWKPGLNVLLVDGCHEQSLNQKLLKELYLKSQALHLLADRNCRLTTLDVSELKGWVDQLCSDKTRSIEYMRWQLERQQEKKRWDGLLLDGHDHWEFIKQLKTNVVLLISDDNQLASEAVNVIQQQAEFVVLKGVFDVIPSGDHSRDWHYYLAEVAQLNKKLNHQDLLIIELRGDQLACLDTLKWKKNLTVVYLKSNGDKLGSAPRYRLRGGLESFSGVAGLPVKTQLEALLTERHCSYYEIPVQDKKFIVELVCGSPAASKAAKKVTMEAC